MNSIKLFYLKLKSHRSSSNGEKVSSKTEGRLDSLNENTKIPKAETKNLKVKWLRNGSNNEKKKLKSSDISCYHSFAQRQTLEFREMKSEARKLFVNNEDPDGSNTYYEYDCKVQSTGYTRLLEPTAKPGEDDLWRFVESLNF